MTTLIFPLSPSIDIFMELHSVAMRVSYPVLALTLEAMLVDEIPAQAGEFESVLLLVLVLGVVEFVT